MSAPETRKVKLWLVRETDKARLFCTATPGTTNAREIWIPRSITHSLSKDHETCVVEVEDWFLEREEL